MFINNSDAQVTLWDVHDKILNDPAMEEDVLRFEREAHTSGSMIFTSKIDPFQQFDLILVSLEGWQNQEFFKKTLSVLILRK
jgi:hypothetical protein